jgi:hypothetical protein
MKWPKIILISSIVNALFFLWIYATQVFMIDWVIAGVFHELFMLPMLLLAPSLFIVSLVQVFRLNQKVLKYLSLIISTTVVGILAWPFLLYLS